MSNADEAYKTRRIETDKRINKLQAFLLEFDTKQEANSKNWAYDGTVLFINAKLQEVIDFLNGEEE